MYFEQIYACTPLNIKMDVLAIIFDERVRPILKFWNFWANFLAVNMSVWTSSVTLAVKQE